MSTTPRGDEKSPLLPDWKTDKITDSQCTVLCRTKRMVSLIPVRFRLLLGLKRGCSFSLFGRMWNFEQAVVFKAQEGFLEAGLQVLLQTYIHLKTDWILMKYFSGYVERGVYLIGI